MFSPLSTPFAKNTGKNAVKDLYFSVKVDSMQYVPKSDAPNSSALRRHCERVRNWGCDKSLAGCEGSLTRSGAFETAFRPSVHPFP
jgi:hypothetical protein